MSYFVEKLDITGQFLYNPLSSLSFDKVNFFMIDSLDRTPSTQDRGLHVTQPQVGDTERPREYLSRSRSDAKLAGEWAAAQLKLHQDLRPGDQITDQRTLICKLTANPITANHFSFQEKDRTPTKHLRVASTSATVPVSANIEENVAATFGEGRDPGFMYCIEVGQLPDGWSAYFDPTNKIPNHISVVHDSVIGVDPRLAQNPPRSARDRITSVFRRAVGLRSSIPGAQSSIFNGRTPQSD